MSWESAWNDIEGAIRKFLVNIAGQELPGPKASAKTGVPVAERIQQLHATLDNYLGAVFVSRVVALLRLTELAEEQQVPVTPELWLRFQLADGDGLFWKLYNRIKVNGFATGVVQDAVDKAMKIFGCPSMVVIFDEFHGLNRSTVEIVVESGYSHALFYRREGNCVNVQLCFYVLV